MQVLTVALPDHCDANPFQLVTRLRLEMQQKMLFYLIWAVVKGSSRYLFERQLVSYP